MTIAFDELYMLNEQVTGALSLAIVRRKIGRRFVVRQLAFGATSGGEWCAAPREMVGDAPDKYHPLYVAALLTARNVFPSPQDAYFPAIHFATDADTRRSMTLNAMKMTREYSQQPVAAPRILQLVEGRLAAGQRDVVHDALVYLMRQILAAREEMMRESELRAAAITAFLGLSPGQIMALSPRRDAQLAATLIASTRRAVDVAGVLEMQRRILRGALIPLRRAERNYLKLLDVVVSKLWDDEEK